MKVRCILRGSENMIVLNGDMLVEFGSFKALKIEDLSSPYLVNREKYLGLLNCAKRILDNEVYSDGYGQYYLVDVGYGAIAVLATGGEDNLTDGVCVCTHDMVYVKPNKQDYYITMGEDMDRVSLSIQGCKNCEVLHIMDCAVDLVMNLEDFIGVTFDVNDVAIRLTLKHIGDTSHINDWYDLGIFDQVSVEGLDFHECERLFRNGKIVTTTKTPSELYDIVSTVSENEYSVTIEGLDSLLDCMEYSEYKGLKDLRNLVKLNIRCEVRSMEFQGDYLCFRTEKGTFYANARQFEDCLLYGSSYCTFYV